MRDHGSLTWTAISDGDGAERSWRPSRRRWSPRPGGRRSGGDRDGLVLVGGLIDLVRVGLVLAVVVRLVVALGLSLRLGLGLAPARRGLGLAGSARLGSGSATGSGSGSSSGSGSASSALGSATGSGAASGSGASVGGSAGASGSIASGSGASFDWSVIRSSSLLARGAGGSRLGRCAGASVPKSTDRP